MSDRETEILQAIRQTLAGFADQLHGHRVILFGSRAAGTARARSDFDVGVDGADPLPLGTFFAIGDRLEALPTLYRIDWLDLQRVSETFRHTALAHQLELYHDPLAVA